MVQEEEQPSLRAGGRLSREEALKWGKSQWGPYLGLITELCYKDIGKDGDCPDTV